MRTKKILASILLGLLKLALAAVIAVGVYRIGEYAYHFGHSVYADTAVSDPPGMDVAVVIPEGSSVAQVAALLEAKGLIQDDKVFIVQERLSKYHGQMKAGNYVLNTSERASQMLALLSGQEPALPEKEEEE